MSITLLHAHYENSEHNDTYAFTGKKAYEAALRQAMILVSEYVGEYKRKDVEGLKRCVEEGRYADAMEEWNSLSTTMQLTIDVTSSYTDESVGLPCFKWTDDD